MTTFAFSIITVCIGRQLSFVNIGKVHTFDFETRGDLSNTEAANRNLRQGQQIKSYYTEIHCELLRDVGLLF